MSARWTALTAWSGWPGILVVLCPLVVLPAAKGQGPLSHLIDLPVGGADAGVTFGVVGDRLTPSWNGCSSIAVAVKVWMVNEERGQGMAGITVLGGTGYGGGAVVAEAARRGHQVTAISRGAPQQPVPGVTYRMESVLDPGVLQRAVGGADVVFEALSPRGDMAGKVEPVFADLVAAADRSGCRLGVLGGASSLLVAEEGPRLIDVEPPAPEVRAEVELGIHKLETLQRSSPALDWFYVSPPAEFGAWVPSTETGTYRLSDDVLLTGPDGTSQISAADLAIAVLDEIDRPTHRRRRFHVAH